MDNLDLVAQLGLEWISEKVEERFGRLAAWVVTLVLGLLILAAFIAPFVIAYNHLAS
jgi:hypothetical protein